MLARLTGRSQAAKASREQKAAAGGTPAAPEAAPEGPPRRASSRRRRRCLKLSSSERQSVPALLEPYRYRARSGAEWESIEHEMQITIKVRDHMETNGHTLYQVRCTMSSASDETAPVLTWGCQRRLEHLRKGLHDVAKDQMGAFYAGCFKGAPFAHRGGIAGTTKRLDVWCGRLARCINSGAAPPLVVAQALRLLHTPRYVPGLEDALAHGQCDLVPKDAGVESVDTTDAELTEPGGEDVESEGESYLSDWESDSEASASQEDDDDLASVAEGPRAEGAEDSEYGADDSADSADDDFCVQKEDSLDLFMRMAAQRGR